MTIYGGGGENLVWRKGKKAIRSAIRDLDEALWHQIENIWINAIRCFHDAQISDIDHMQGSLHCERVEENLAILIPDKWKGKKVSALELFTLSAAAALHDSGKRRDIVGDHGIVAAKALREHPEKFWLDPFQADAVSKLVEAHNNHRLGEVPETFNIGLETLHLRDLAALFCLADTLHCDYTRVLKQITKEGEKRAMKNPVTIFRLRVSGFNTDDKGYIRITATPRNSSELQVIDKGFQWIINNEMRPIIPTLREAGYPYELSLHKDLSYLRLETKIRKESHILSEVKNIQELIDLERKRKLDLVSPSDNNTKVAVYRRFLEIFLRNFVSEKLEECYGKEWWRKNVPEGVQEKSAKRKKKLIETGEVIEAEPLINFADFIDLKEIFFFKNNWHDVFMKYYGGRKEHKYIIENKFFPELYRIRTDETHSRKISDEDVKKFEVYSLELLCIEEYKNQFKELMRSGEIPSYPSELKRPLFEDIESWITKNIKFPKKEDFDNGLVYSDKLTKKAVIDLLESKRCCLLYGAPASRKTTFSLLFGLELLKKGYSVFYFEIKEQNIKWEYLFEEVKSHEDKKSLFIIDDCHKSTGKVYEFIHRVKRETENANFLFVSRKISIFDDPDYNYFEELKETSVELAPREEAFRGIIEQFCIFRKIENYAERIGNINEIIKTCGSDMWFLYYLLEAWYDTLKAKKEEIILSDVTRKEFYEKISKRYNIRENRDYLIFCALYQFEIPIPYDFPIGEQIPDTKISRWLKEGLIFESESPNYTMSHSSFARVILKAGEAGKLLVLERGHSSKSLEDYTVGIIEKYLHFEETNLDKIIYRIYRDEEIRIIDKLININNHIALSAMINFFNSEADLNSKINFLAFLKSHEQVKNEVIKNLDFNKIAEQIKNVELSFQQLTTLLNSIEGRQEELIVKLDFSTLSKLSEEISNVPPNKFQDIANLFDALGSSKINVIKLLDYDKISENVYQTNRGDFRGLTLLMARLDEEYRNKLIEKVDWASLCIKCPINMSLLRALGGLLENLWKQAEILSDNSGEEKVAQYLLNRESEVIEAIEYAYKEIKNYLNTHTLIQINKKRARRAATMYAGLGKFLFNYARIDYDSAFNLIIRNMNKLIECFEVAPIAYYYIGQLVNVFRRLDPDLSYSLLTNNKIRGRIQWSINNHNWSANEKGLEHLIEAFYRSTPVLWKKMVDYKWITADLSLLDLDSIYKKVDEENTEENYMSYSKNDKTKRRRGRLL